MGQKFDYKYVFTPIGVEHPSIQATKGNSITEGIDAFISNNAKFMLTLMECKQVGASKFEVSFDNKFSESMDEFIVDQIPS